MQLRERIIPNSEMADVNSNFNSAVEASLLELERLGMSRVLRNEKLKATSTLVFRTRFARSTKTYTTFTSCQNAACSNTFFLRASKLCSGGFSVLTEQMWFSLLSLSAPSPLPWTPPISSSLREFQHGAFASKNIRAPEENACTAG